MTRRLAKPLLDVATILLPPAAYLWGYRQGLVQGRMEGALDQLISFLKGMNGEN